VNSWLGDPDASPTPPARRQCFLPRAPKRSTLTPITPSRIASELDELPLPYRFDVEAYPCIEHQPLRDHIDRVGKPFFVAESR